MADTEPHATNDSGRERRPVRPRHMALVVVGLVVAYLPVWAWPLVGWFDPDAPERGPASAIPLNWVAVVLIVGWVFGVERLRFDSMRLSMPSTRDIEWAFYLWGAAMGWYWLASLIGPDESTTSAGVDEIAELGVATVAALVVTTAVCEEILVRGYASERIGALFGRRWAGAAATAVPFVGAHVGFFGIDWLWYHAAGTVAIYVLYVWRENVVACIVLHALINAPVLIPTVFNGAS